MDKLWKTETSDVLIADRHIHLRRERVTTERGAVLDPYYVLTYPDWAVCVALTDADELVMVRQYRHGTGTVALELPGGCVDPHDQTPLDAALRELREETGYGPGESHYLGGLAANPAMQTNHLHVAVVTGVARSFEAALEPGEELTVELVPVKQALRLALTGGIEQSMHIAALFLGLAHVGRIDLAG